MTRSPRRPGRSARAALVCQGMYYTATGLWPLLDERSFQAATGPKTDLWLVKTVGALVSVVGATLVVGGIRGATGPEMPLLAAGSAGALAVIDATYVSGGRSSRVYLLDAALELGFACWAIGALGRRARGVAVEPAAGRVEPAPPDPDSR